MTRRLKYWGWGYEDEQPSADEMRDAAGFLIGRFGFGSSDPEQPAPLSVSNTSNFLTTAYPRLMRCAIMAAACEYVKDSGQGNFDRTYWAQLTQVEIDQAQAESDRARRAVQAGIILEGGGGVSGMPPYGYGFT